MTNFIKNRYIIGAVTALGLLLALGFCAPSSASSLEEVNLSSHKLVWNGMDMCSMTAISPTEFLTAAHCVTMDGPLSVKFGSNSYELKVDKINVGDDVAVLSFVELDYKIENTNYVDISSDYTPKWGDPLYAVGYPRGDILTITFGLFTGVVKIDNLIGLTGPFWKTTVPITGGSSGGGLYFAYWNVDEGRLEYELVGTATAAWKDVDFQSYFSTLDSVREIVYGS